MKKAEDLKKKWFFQKKVFLKKLFFKKVMETKIDHEKFLEFYFVHFGIKIYLFFQKKFF